MASLKSYFELGRPHQYVKNVFVLLPLFFGHRLADPVAVGKGLFAFLAFSCCASAIYAINDVVDAAADREHPEKSRRPVAAGQVSIHQAYGFALLFLALSAVCSIVLGSRGFTLALLAYLALNVLYNFSLKRLALVDISCIGAGFVLRVVAGGQAVSVPVSHWIVIVTFLLALFLALAKRRDDVLLAGSQGNKMRENIGHYNLEFISAAMVLMASVTIVCYIMYTVSPNVILQHGSDMLYLTGFWVILGFLRYMQITFVENRSGSPTLVLLHDLFLQVILVAWLATFFVLLYTGEA